MKVSPDIVVFINIAASEQTLDVVSFQVMTEKGHVFLSTHYPNAINKRGQINEPIVGDFDVDKFEKLCENENVVWMPWKHRDGYYKFCSVSVMQWLERTRINA